MRFADQHHKGRTSAHYSHTATATPISTRRTKLSKRPVARDSAKEMEGNYWEGLSPSFWMEVPQGDRRRHVRSRPPPEPSAGVRSGHHRRSREKARVDELEDAEKRRRQRRRRRPDNVLLNSTERLETSKRRRGHADGAQNARSRRSDFADVDEEFDDGRMYESSRRGVSMRRRPSREGRRNSRNIRHATPPPLSEESESSDSSAQSEQLAFPTPAGRKSARRPLGKSASDRHSTKGDLHHLPQLRASERVSDNVYRNGASANPETSPNRKRRRAHTSREPGTESNVGKSRAPPAPSPPLAPSPSRATSPSSAFSSSDQPYQYYNPDGVGNKRFSQGREKQHGLDAGDDQVYKSDSDDSFLGDGDTGPPGDGDSGRIPSFPARNSHYLNAVDPPSTISEDELEGGTITNQTAPEMEERSILRDEWRQLSQNLKRAHSPKSLSRKRSQTGDGQLRPQPVRKISKGQSRRKKHLQPEGNLRKHFDRSQEREKEENAFTTIPTTTHTTEAPGLLTLARRRSQKHPDMRRMSRTLTDGTKENAWDKPQRISIQVGSRPPMLMSLDKSNTLSLTSSQDGPRLDIPANETRALPEPSSQEDPQNMLGYTPMPEKGSWPVEHPVEDMRDDFVRSPSPVAVPKGRRRSFKDGARTSRQHPRESPSFDIDPVGDMPMVDSSPESDDSSYMPDNVKPWRRSPLSDFDRVETPPVERSAALSDGSAYTHREPRRKTSQSGFSHHIATQPKGLSAMAHDKSNHLSRQPRQPRRRSSSSAFNRVETPPAEHSAMASDDSAHIPRKHRKRSSLSHFFNPAGIPQKQHSAVVSDPSAHMPQPQGKSSLPGSFNRVGTSPVGHSARSFDDDIVDIPDVSESDAGLSNARGKGTPSAPPPPPPPPVPQPPAIPQATKPRFARRKSNRDEGSQPLFAHNHSNATVVPGYVQWPSGQNAESPQDNGTMSGGENETPAYSNEEGFSRQSRAMPNYLNYDISNFQRPGPHRVRKLPTQHGYGLPTQQFDEAPLHRPSAIPRQRTRRRSSRQSNRMPFKFGNEFPIQGVQGLVDDTEVSSAEGSESKDVTSKEPGFTERCRQLFERAMAAIPFRGATESKDTDASFLARSGALRGANTSKSMRSFSREARTVGNPENPPRLWARLNRQDIALFLRRFGHYILYFIAFGFFMMVLGRIAGFIAYVGSWIAWFAGPFVWVFGTVGGLLVG